MSLFIQVKDANGVVVENFNLDECIDYRMGTGTSAVLGDTAKMAYFNFDLKNSNVLGVEQTFIALLLSLDKAKKIEAEHRTFSDGFQYQFRSIYIMDHDTEFTNPKLYTDGVVTRSANSMVWATPNTVKDALNTNSARVFETFSIESLEYALQNDSWYDISGENRSRIEKAVAIYHNFKELGFDFKGATVEQLKETYDVEEKFATQCYKELMDDRLIGYGHSADLFLSPDEYNEALRHTFRGDYTQAMDYSSEIWHDGGVDGFVSSMFTAKFREKITEAFTPEGHTRPININDIRANKALQSVIKNHNDASTYGISVSAIGIAGAAEVGDHLGAKWFDPAKNAYFNNHLGQLLFEKHYIKAGIGVEVAKAAWSAFSIAGNDAYSESERTALLSITVGGVVSTHFLSLEAASLAGGLIKGTGTIAVAGATVASIASGVFIGVLVTAAATALSNRVNDWYDVEELKDRGYAPLEFRIEDFKQIS